MLKLCKLRSTCKELGALPYTFKIHTTKQINILLIVRKIYYVNAIADTYLKLKKSKLFKISCKN